MLLLEEQLILLPKTSAVQLNGNVLKSKSNEQDKSITLMKKCIQWSVYLYSCTFPMNFDFKKCQEGCMSWYTRVVHSYTQNKKRRIAIVSYLIEG